MGYSKKKKRVLTEGIYIDEFIRGRIVGFCTWLSTALCTLSSRKSASFTLTNHKLCADNHADPRIHMPQHDCYIGHLPEHKSPLACTS